MGFALPPPPSSLTLPRRIDTTSVVLLVLYVPSRSVDDYGVSIAPNVLNSLVQLAFHHHHASAGTPCLASCQKDTPGSQNRFLFMGSEEVSGTQGYCVQAGRQTASAKSMSGVLRTSEV